MPSWLHHLSILLSSLQRSHKPRTALSERGASLGGWRGYWLVAMLALAMVLGPTLGQMHRAVHAATPASVVGYSGGAHAAHAPSADAAACVATADANGCSSGDWIHALFAGHGPADCQLLDQAGHGYAGPPALLQLAAVAPESAQVAVIFTRPRAIFVAASFDARAPPASHSPSA